jgi:hypothetical protein
MYTAQFKADGAPTFQVSTFSLQAMSLDYRQYIENNNLVACHCHPVIIRKSNDPLYRLAYNGKVFNYTTGERVEL